VELTPKIPTAARSIAVDFPGLTVGVAEYEEGPTGCTVLLLDRYARMSIDIGGGMPGVFNHTAPVTEAVCLTGGSTLGLAACTGVASELYELRGSDPLTLPVVTGSVIYDFAAPERSGVYPDAELGRAASRAATSGAIPVGAVGAARSATCGKLGIAGWAERGGQGAAFGVVGECRVVVLVVVNSLGVIVDRGGHVVRGNRDPATGQRSHVTAAQMVHGAERQRERFGRATTLTVVLTDARLPSHALQQLPRQIHASIARAIHPFNAIADGDTLWLLTTNAVDDASIVPTAFGAFASELVWDAVLSSLDPDPTESVASAGSARSPVRSRV
jgi:L-aminopeptidase/D-esterase-like protein